LNISVILPAFNEELNIKIALKEIIAYLENKRLNNWEIIVVDDGSTDKTEEEIKKIIRTTNNVFLKKHKFNLGYGKTLQTGIKNVKFDWIFITDSDLQFFINDLDKFIPLTNNYNFIQGIRKKRSDPLSRIILGKTYKSIINLFFKIPVSDPECSFRLFKKNLLDHVNIVCSGPMVPIELILEAKNNDAKFYEKIVRHQSRKFGNTNALSFKSFSALVKDFFNLLSKKKTINLY